MPKRLSLLLILTIHTIVNAQQSQNILPVSEERGVKFEQNLDWQQVLTKAKAENKYIFLDCFATWCGPCKAMDKEVYTNDKVAQVINDQFISVKVQMDKTPYDDAFIKKWHYNAFAIQSHYNVTAFPTFLFFSPSGIPLHKGVGFKNPEQFITLLQETFNPNKQYYNVLSNFEPGKMDTAEMKGLARSFINSDKGLAGKIAADYLTRINSNELIQPENLQFMTDFNENPQVQQILVQYLNTRTDSELTAANNLRLINSFKTVPAVRNLALVYLTNLPFEKLSNKSNLEMLGMFNTIPLAKEIADRYINSLPEEKLFTKEHIQLLTAFTKTSNDRGFKIFYHQGKKVNAVMILKQAESKNVAVITTDYAGRVSDNIITKEEIGPYWEKAVKENDINWEKISKVISSKYNKEVAYRTVLNSKVNLYKYFAEKHNRNWPEYIKYNIEKIQKYGTDTTSGFADAIELNNFAYGAVFLHSNDKQQIDVAIKIMAGVVRRRSNDEGHIDTYASLLYKAGRTREAIQWEEKAFKIAISKNSDESTIKMYENIIAKMKKGEVIWMSE